MNTNKRSRWEMFHGTPNRVNREGPRVTLNPRSVFLLNMAAYEALGRPAAVGLGYDESTRTIGMVAQDPRNLSSFPLKGKVNHKKYTYRIVHAAPFCRHYEISPKRTILFNRIDFDNEGFLLLELSTAVAVTRGFR